VTVLRCTRCRLTVDVGASSTPARRCAACGGPLESALAPATIWDEDAPTVRRPISYVNDAAARTRR
jgi:hypothetical protein